MSLYLIRSMGIEAHCSDLIVDPDDPEVIHFLSVCGHQITVKGIVANLLQYSGATISIQGKERDLVCSDMGYKVLMKRLPSGLAHALVFPKATLPGHSDDKNKNRFSIITPDKAQIPILFFRHLDKKIDIPIDPSWVRWLWKTFRKQKWLIKLKTLAGDFKGYHFEFQPARIHELISEALKEGIPEVTECLAWKGGHDGNGDFPQRLSA